MLDGQKMYGSSSGYDNVREYLMKSCDLHEVILCPAGTFTSTASKTCILFFTKKKERKDVVEITGIKRILKFCKSHSTKKVKFYDFNPDTEEKHFIKEVEIDEIASKNYSLNYTEYGIEEEENNDEEGIEWLELEKVYDKISTGSSINKNEIKEGIYPYYGANGIVNYVDVYDYDGEYLLIGRAGSSGKINYVKGKFKPNDNVFVISAKNIRYIYYLLVLNKYFKNIIKDGVIPVINKTNISKIKVPIPSIEMQNKIVEFLDKLYDKKIIKVENTSDYYEGNDIFRLLLDKKYNIFEKLVEWQEQTTELLKQIEFFKNRQSKYLYFVNQTENTLKTLSEICKINIGGTPRRDNPDYWNNGTNIWVSIRELNDNIITDSTEKITDLGVKESNVKLIPKDTILFSFKLSIGKIAISGCDLYTNEAIAGLIIQENQVIMKYLYYILKEINTFSSKGCIGGGSLNKESLSKIKIPVPSLERQKEIVEYCEYNDTLIKQLEKEIENNKKQAQQFITGIVKAQLQTEEQSDTSSVNTEPIDEVQNEIVSVEEEIIIEPKPKVKKIVKKIKKPLVIVEDNEV
jgi:restriction endonuclease S subunit